MATSEKSTIIPLLYDREGKCFDAKLKRITGVAEPQTALDAVNLAYMEKTCHEITERRLAVLANDVRKIRERIHILEGESYPDISVMADVDLAMGELHTRVSEAKLMCGKNCDNCHGILVDILQVCYQVVNISNPSIGNREKNQNGECGLIKPVLDEDATVEDGDGIGDRSVKSVTESKPNESVTESKPNESVTELGGSLILTPMDNTSLDDRIPMGESLAVYSFVFAKNTNRSGETKASLGHYHFDGLLHKNKQYKRAKVEVFYKMNTIDLSSMYIVFPNNKSYAVGVPNHINLDTSDIFPDLSFRLAHTPDTLYDDAANFTIDLSHFAKKKNDILLPKGGTFSPLLVSVRFF